MRIPGAIVKSWFFFKITGFFFTHAAFLVPGERLEVTDNWLAVRHPDPSYPVHILLIPKKPIPDWLCFTVNEKELFAEFVRISQRLIRDEGMESNGYRLIINGGEYQSIPQLHIHLVSGDPLADKQGVKS